MTKQRKLKLRVGKLIIPKDLCLRETAKCQSEPFLLTLNCHFISIFILGPSIFLKRLNFAVACPGHVSSQRGSGVFQPF